MAYLSEVLEKAVRFNKSNFTNVKRYILNDLASALDFKANYTQSKGHMLNVYKHAYTNLNIKSKIIILYAYNISYELREFFALKVFQGVYR